MGAVVGAEDDPCLCAILSGEAAKSESLGRRLATVPTAPGAGGIEGFLEADDRIVRAVEEDNRERLRWLAAQASSGFRNPADGIRSEAAE